MIRRWLRSIRIKKGMSQKEIAEMVGIAQPSYWKIECGQCNPSVDTAKRIASVLNFDWTKFFDDSDGQSDSDNEQPKNLNTDD